MAIEDRIMCISAHAADSCVRAVGTLARYANAGAPVRVVVLSRGARGESNEILTPIQIFACEPTQPMIEATPSPIRDASWRASTKW